MDVAILIHDMVYDGKTQVEIRSVEAFVQMIKNVTKQYNMVDLPEKVYMPFGVISPLNIADQVFYTIDHKPMKGKDNRLILLDLYSFAKGAVVVKNNYLSLLDELVILYPDANRIDIKYNMRKNLIRICKNIVDFTVSNEDDEYYDAWIKIQNGIAEQIAVIEKEILDDYEKLERQNKV